MLPVLYIRCSMGVGSGAAWAAPIICKKKKKKKKRGKGKGRRGERREYGEGIEV